MKRLKFIITVFITGVSAGWILPFAAQFFERTDFSGNYRIPYSMGEDYWLFRRYSRVVSHGSRIAMIGDSVIWGHYTARENSLPAQMNRLYGRDIFANMGLDGIHPAAMNGLTVYCTPGLKNRKIIVGINLLWMSSEKHDLSGAVNSEINHRVLLPQFYPSIPSFRPTFENRLSALVSRSVPIFGWLDHVRLTRFDSGSFYLWTMEHPHESPFKFFVKTGKEETVPEGISPEMMREQSISWISPEKSVQWRFMLETLTELKKRGNRVAAIITPFNTYMMTPESRKTYFRIITEMEWILRENGIIPIIPAPLEKRYFADSSHPGADGYRAMAVDILQNREFTEFLGE